MHQELNYSDIQLLPEFCIVKSRKECDTSMKLGNRKFKLPVVPANMRSVITESFCEYLAKNNYFYIMHRFGVDNVEFIKNMMYKELYTSISLGVNEDSYEQLQEIKRNNLKIDYATIDIAHGHCQKMADMIHYLKDNFPGIYVIAGNVCTSDGIIYLEENDADCVKIGISCGAACITRLKTGFGRPMVSTLLECGEVAKKPFIADGGIEYHADIAKALALGATCIMAGNLFSGYDESAGNIISIQENDSGHVFERQYKEYFGSASQYNKNTQRNIEGRKKLVPYKGSVLKLLDELEQDIQSAISYAGGKDLSALTTVKWIRVKY